MIALSVAALLSGFSSMPSPGEPYSPRRAFYQDSSPQETEDNAAFFLAYVQRTLDDSQAWSPIDEPTGFALDFTSNTDGFGFEGGLAYAEDSTEVGVFGSNPPLQVEVFSKFFELSLGGRLTLGGEAGGLYVGAGGAYVNAEAETTIGGIFTDGGKDDNTFGLYLHGGAYLRLKTLLLGVDYRVLGGADLELEFDNGTLETSADYAQLAFMIGFGS
jgi:hypothetical protein